MSEKLKLRTTVQAAKELGVGRDLLGYMVILGRVKGTQPVGRSIVWPDAALEEARQVLAELASKREACAA